ncbi:hypothetical protein [Sebaldella sp. S0638]|uniref:hypothetical protein n=1 Tax=Sebaldella sp. S0638 TaxID=2957809 RepID=UPI0020A16244|nr:hypothetical protein [Sebaldella sp. S0638]MCP1226069.1 hypothetical protein [Sebaldella sp. S0638]
MRKNIFLVVLILVLSFQLNAKKITNKVFVHPTAENLSKEEVAVLGITKNVTLIEVDKSKFKVNGDRVHLSPGRHTFQVKRPLGIGYDGELSATLEAGKYYVLDIWSEPAGGRYYRIIYKVFEVSEEDFENYNRKMLDRLIKESKS